MLGERWDDDLKSGHSSNEVYKKHSTRGRLLAPCIPHVVFGLRAVRLMVPVLLGPVLRVPPLGVVLISVGILFTSSVFVVIIVLSIVFLGLLPLLFTLCISSKTLATCLVGVCLLIRVWVGPSWGIVLGLCLWVGKYVISFSDLFEFSFVLRLAVCCIRMILLGKFIKLLFNFGVSGCFRNPQPSVVVCIRTEGYGCCETSHSISNINQPSLQSYWIMPHKLREKPLPLICGWDCTVMTEIR